MSNYTHAIRAMKSRFATRGSPWFCVFLQEEGRPSSQTTRVQEQMQQRLLCNNKSDSKSCRISRVVMVRQYTILKILGFYLGQYTRGKNEPRNFKLDVFSLQNGKENSH